MLGMRHFRVQLIGGIVLHQGRIAEMKTGEGKTLVATLPLYLNALEGRAHLVTVNDYLAKRDSEMDGARSTTSLRLSVGLIVHGLNNAQRKKAYACDITYGTNNEFGFDYLRDNMVIYKGRHGPEDLHYAIVDEVDSILIDEARTPLIISGAGDKSTDLYVKANSFASRLRAKIFAETDDKQPDDDIDADYIVDEKAHTATLTEKGVAKAEQYFGVENLADPENLTLSHHINQALKAHGLMKRDREYVVKDGEVIIVDEFTGRLMFGRRYSDGLHQAIEAKEGVKVERESKTLATITFQNFFRMYKKLAGMTGTALTEEEEFRAIYKLDVIEIPTNMPMIRIDHPDCVYKNEPGKFRAVINEIEECHKRGQPVLVGTISIEKSELLSTMLKKRGIPHQVLNAKFHEKEAEIVAQAGRLGTVTIATNMAGRGTDIMLGGNPEFLAKQELRKQGYPEEIISECTSFAVTENEEVLNARAVYRELHEQFRELTDAEKERVIELGGLHIIGTERHESRRIDNQLRGRSGRQGDPGSSRFYISLEDDLMRLFGSDRLTAVVSALGMEDDQPIEHGMLTNAIENAQRRVEGKNFDIRKRVLQYDDVMNQQREIIYSQRRQVLNGENLKDSFTKMVENTVNTLVDRFCGENLPDMWDWEGINAQARDLLPDMEKLSVSRKEMDTWSKEDLKETLLSSIAGAYEAKETEYGPDIMRELERIVLLRTVDEKWMDHIDAMDQLRYGIGMRAYGQRDPVVEYKFEGFEMFEEMIRSIQYDSVKRLLRMRINREQGTPKREKVAEPVSAGHGGGPRQPVVRSGAKVGRNDPCPCGSGKKYKKCCGAG